MRGARAGTGRSIMGRRRVCPHSVEVVLAAPVFAPVLEVVVVLGSTRTSTSTSASTSTSTSASNTAAAPQQRCSSTAAAQQQCSLRVSVYLIGVSTLRRVCSGSAVRGGAWLRVCFPFRSRCGRGGRAVADLVASGSPPELQVATGIRCLRK